MSVDLLFFTLAGVNYQGPWVNKGSMYLEYQCWGNRTRMQPWGIPCKTHFTQYENASPLTLRNIISDLLFQNEWLLTRPRNAPNAANLHIFLHTMNQMMWPLRWGRWQNTLENQTNLFTQIRMMCSGSAGTYVEQLPWRFGGLAGNAQRTDNLKMICWGSESSIELNIPISQGDSALIVNQKIQQTMLNSGFPDASLTAEGVTWRQMPYPRGYEDCMDVEITDNICGVKFGFCNMVHEDPYFSPVSEHA